MVMPMCSKGDILDNVNGDMFEPAEWNLDDFSADCQRKYGVTPRPDWAIVEYGGRDVDSASNIVFRCIFEIESSITFLSNLCCKQTSIPSIKLRKFSTFVFTY